MVALMFCGHRFWNGYHCAVAWAGDSRAHLIDKQGNYLLLTQDHHDEVGNLTSAYATPDGRCRGDLDVRNFVFAHRPLALGVTTDGVHGKCTEEELRCFLSWSLLQRDMESKSFGDAAENFLENNLSDNLSAVFVMRRIGLPEKILRGALEQWRDTHARTGN
jgi:serine/threonine protein phosphatase PrpC